MLSMHTLHNIIIFIISSFYYLKYQTCNDHDFCFLIAQQYNLHNKSVDFLFSKWDSTNHVQMAQRFFNWGQWKVAYVP